MNDLRDTEVDYWAGWRMRWLPRIFAIAGVVLIAVITRIAWPDAPQAKPKYEVDSVLVADAVIASGVCHAWLRTDRKRTDSLESLNYEHVGPGSGKKFPCMTWLIMNGERP